MPTPADYRLMTEATGQRIAAALEALSGTGAAAAAARQNLDVYSTGETDALIQQSTASSYVTEQKSVNNTDAIASGSTRRFEIPISKTGYTPIGIVGITGSGTTGLSVQEYYVQSSSLAYVYMRNVYGSSITPSSISAYILYRKNS